MIHAERAAPYVAPWPDALGRFELDHNGRQIPVEVYSRSLGIGVLPDRPNTEVRQLDMQIPYGDLAGFRDITLGIPLPTRTDDPFLRVVPYDGGEIVLVVCEIRIRYRDEPFLSWAIFHNDGTYDEGRRRDDGRRLTKAQDKKLDQATSLLDAIPQGRFTLRGRPHEERDAARERLLEAGRRLQARSWTIGRRELRVALSLGSVEGVSALLRRAEWRLKDLKKQLNLVHSGAPGVSYR